MWSCTPTTTTSSAWISKKLGELCNVVVLQVGLDLKTNFKGVGLGLSLGLDQFWTSVQDWLRHSQHCHVKLKETLLYRNFTVNI